MTDLPRDPNQLAKSIIDAVTGQQPSSVDNRDPAAVELGAQERVEGRRGGGRIVDARTARRDR